MSDNFKFKALTSQDFLDGKKDNLIYDDGLKLDKSTTGKYYSESLDSGMENCQWHKLVIDAEIPLNTTLAFSFAVSNEMDANTEQADTIVFRNGNRDALIQIPTGRYLSLEIFFQRENEDDPSPALKQVQLYYPRHSYLRYLPVIYQQDHQSSEFLERFLSIFETLFYGTEQKIVNIPAYFDPLAAPEEFYKWLASWLSLDLYELLGEKNREFILRAVEFYKQKGTVNGLAELVSLLTNLRCCVKEYMNNIFRSYGMDHVLDNEAKYGRDTDYCQPFYRKISKTVDTMDTNLLLNIGSYQDELHYTIDTSEKGKFNRNVIGLYIFIPDDQKAFLIDEYQLHKIINAFLPVFVRVKIYIVGVSSLSYSIKNILESYCDSIQSLTEITFTDIQDAYRDRTNWAWLFSIFEEHDGYTNDKNYRTVHTEIEPNISAIDKYDLITIKDIYTDNIKHVRTKIKRKRGKNEST